MALFDKGTQKGKGITPNPGKSQKGKGIFSSGTSNKGKGQLFPGTPNNKPTATTSSSVVQTTQNLNNIEQTVNTINKTVPTITNQGPTGPEGPKGDKGDQGIKGDTGSQGIPGTKGDTGSQGNTGNMGAQGAQGIQGIKGDTGSQGNDGTTGQTGQTGETGATGSKGDTGADGSKGDKGNTGQTGAKGSKGDVGGTSTITGFETTTEFKPILETSDGNFTGTFSIRGAQGSTGNTGSTGAKGDQGIQGIQGLKGDQGNKGIKGDTGSAGAKGDDGSIGSQGPRGIQGIQGTTGDTGAQGAQGAMGSTGTKGDTGNTGGQGIQGNTGNTGVKGDKGNVGPTPTFDVTSTNTTDAGTAASVQVSPGVSTDNYEFIFDIPRGQNGLPNVLSIGTVTTKDTGEDATASITGTAPAQVLNLGLPKGESGTSLSATGSTGSTTQVFSFTDDNGNVWATTFSRPDGSPTLNAALLNSSGIIVNSVSKSIFDTFTLNATTLRLTAGSTNSTNFPFESLTNVTSSDGTVGTINNNTVNITLTTFTDGTSYTGTGDVKIANKAAATLSASRSVTVNRFTPYWYGANTTAPTNFAGLNNLTESTSGWSGSLTNSTAGTFVFATTNQFTSCVLDGVQDYQFATPTTITQADHNSVDQTIYVYSMPGLDPASLGSFAS